MKILVLAPEPFFQDRGTPIAVRLLVSSLARDGHEVDLLTFHEGRDVPLDGARLHRIPSLPGMSGIRPGFSARKVVCDAAMLVRGLRLARRNRYDILHAVEESAFIALLLKKLLGIPYIYDMDSSMSQQLVDKYAWLGVFRRLLTACEALAIRQSRGVVAVCRFLEEEALRHHPTGDVLRLEDVSLLDADGAAPAEELAVPHPFALYVGNLESYQGIDLLVGGMRHLVDGNTPGHMAIVGGNDADIASYRQLCADRDLSERVHFLGRRPIAMLGGLLSQADVVVSPRTRGHNTPMKIYSYLDSGKPLLATRLPTHTQVLDDEIACLVEPEPRAFGEGLRTLFSKPEMAAELGRRARERARAEFTPEAFHRKLSGFYRRLFAAPELELT